MTFKELNIKGVFEIQLEPKEDERGYFARNFAKEEFAARGIDYNIVHIDRSFNKKRGTTRGMHYQQAPKAEDKILQCLRGRFYYVALDIRKNSPTYGKWISVELDPEKRNMVLAPKGCASGIQVLEDNSELQYFITEVYSPEHGRGIRWNDPYFGIKWPIKEPTAISEKDANWPLVDPKNPPIVDL